MTRRAQATHHLAAPAEPADAQDPRWLELPESRRAVAQERSRILDRYLTLDRRGAEDARRAAAELGVTRSYFYEMLKEWRERRSLLALVPYAKPLRKRADAPRLPAEVMSLLRKSIAERPGRAPRDILAEVSARWPHRTDLPTADALHDVIGEVLSAPSGGFSLNAADAEHAARAASFGEVVVVDHTAAASLFINSAEGPRRPIITLVMDLATTTVAGFSLGLGRPGASQVRAALQDAVRRSIGDDIAPTILVNTDWHHEWHELEEELRRAGGVPRMRRSPKLHFGTATQRLVGRSLGRLKLVPRKAHDPAAGAAEFDPAIHSALRLEEAIAVIENNSWAHAEPLLAGIEPRHIALNLTA